MSKPATGFRISNSKARTWARCPKQYEFNYVRGLQTMEEAIPLKRGSWLHELLDAIYSGRDWKEVHKRLTGEFNKLFDQEKERLGDMPGDCYRLIENYQRMYAKRDAKWEVLATEVQDTILLPNGDEFTYIIDLIYRDSMGVWILDHKTVSSFMEETYLVMDTQLARYHYVASRPQFADKVGYDVSELRGIVYNEIRTKAPTVPKLLQSGKLSTAKNIDTDYFTYLKAIKEHGLDPKDYRDFLTMLRGREESRFYRRTPMPKDKTLTKNLMRDLLIASKEMKAATESGHFRRNPTKDCKWDCAYKNACFIELHGGDATAELKQRFTTREERARHHMKEKKETP